MLCDFESLFSGLLIIKQYPDTKLVNIEKKWPTLNKALKAEGKPKV